ncbi:phenylacetate--CoA ligase family protein [uncultured Selenomonas sp.]|uniref:phenylacetate--CoA ligase family protein n=1 Tax=uncultured Selenomonas sp. TaxID=159275 RepID=UPI0028E2B280|nr:phenylacetate--CoA ligase family protein [uncultured Selenomonas sp.]
MTGTALTEEQRLSLLLRQIKWAEEKTAFYRAAFERAGVSAASVSSFAEAARLPLLECAEEEGADAPFFMLTLPLSGLLRMSVLHDDAGRGRIHCYTQGDVARQVQTVTDMLAACGVNRASTVLLAGDFADSRMLDLQYALDGIGAAVLPCGGGAAAAQVLCAAVPDTIIVWEHELLALEKYLGDIAVHRLITVGTHIAPQQASRALAERMGARHTHIFTLAQMGALIGATCTAGGGIPLEERLFYAEVIDKAGHSSREDGAHGELVLSTIAAEAMPVLRYRTGLHVRLVRESTQISIIEE